MKLYPKLENLARKPLLIEIAAQIVAAYRVNEYGYNAGHDDVANWALNDAEELLKEYQSRATDEEKES